MSVYPAYPLNKELNKKVFHPFDHIKKVDPLTNSVMRCTVAYSLVSCTFAIEKHFVLLDSPVIAAYE